MDSNKAQHDTFLNAYEALNVEQRLAVDTIEGPVMVIAGPGTGKTQVLTLRIANIPRLTDTRPESILALTFTEAGVSAMRTRLFKYIGQAAYDVRISTFHGFASGLVSQYPDAYPRLIGSGVASELKKIILIQSILNETTYTTLRPQGAPDYYIPAILSAISNLKREYIVPDSFAASVAIQAAALAHIPRYHERGLHVGKERGEYTRAETHLRKNQELLSVYRAYEAGLRSQKRYDYDDMIVETVAALSQHERMLRDLQETHQYVLADEHQDVNGAQNRILEKLVNFHDRPNIFVVGDEKQAIFRFQGASLDNFLYFEDAFPHTKVIALTKNYRSGQTILDAAHALIKSDDPRVAELRVPLQAATEHTAAVERHHFTAEDEEDMWVVEQVEQAMSAGTPAEEIAIIVRTNREVERFAWYLRTAHVPVEPTAERNVLTHPLYAAMRALIEAALSPHSAPKVAHVLLAPYWKLDPTDVHRILEATNVAEPLPMILTSEAIMARIGVREPVQCARVSRVLAQANERAITMSPDRVVELLFIESGFRDYVLAESPYDGLPMIRRFYDEVIALVEQKTAITLSDVVSYLEALVAHHIELAVPARPAATGAVTVTTAHKAKGLEWNIVFAPHLTEQRWEKSHKRQTFDLMLTKHDIDEQAETLDDVRRLLYVVVTRARNRLVLSHADIGRTGSGSVPSRFVNSLAVLPTSYTTPVQPILEVQTVFPDMRIDHSFVAAVMVKRGISATHFNTYLRSPWQYFFNHIVRVPQLPEFSTRFGTALHSVLDEMQGMVIAGTMPTVTSIEPLLKKRLLTLPLTLEEYARAHERGLLALTAYLPHFLSTTTRESVSEVRLKASLKTGLAGLPEITLTGSLDRVDRRDDGMVIKVVDYKTGSPKTRNHIEGKTTSSRGDYKRQLVFYALLLSLQADSKWHSKTGVLSFIEPNRHGVVKEESFTITDEEIENLKVQIITMVQSVADGSWVRSPCDEKNCSYSHIIEMWQRKSEE